MKQLADYRAVISGLLALALMGVVLILIEIELFPWALLIPGAWLVVFSYRSYHAVIANQAMSEAVRMGSGSYDSTSGSDVEAFLP